MEDVAELHKLAQIAPEMADFAFDAGARERFTAAAFEYEEPARQGLEFIVAPALAPAKSVSNR